MALGALPTKTAVQISDGSGNKAEIPAAYEGAAGVMTPEHVKDLKSLMAWREAILTGGDRGGKASADVVTRSELNEALALASSRASNPETLTDARIAALEDRATRVASAIAQIKAAPDVAEVKRMVRDAVASELAARPASSQPSQRSDASEIALLNAKVNDLAEALTTFAAAAANSASLGSPSLKPLADMINDLNDRLTSVENVLVTIKRMAGFRSDAA